MKRISFAWICITNIGMILFFLVIIPILAIFDRKYHNNYKQRLEDAYAKIRDGVR